MNIKIGNQYLDFNADIEIERQVKLFEEAATTNGDFSYDFTIQATGKNRGIFQLFSIDQGIKTIYQKIPSIIESAPGTPIYFGFIKVEKDRDYEIDCSFFSGNSNWFNELNFSLRDFDLSIYDVDWDKASITARETATTGVIFPVINTGAMDTRSYVNWHIDDFHPFIYVRSVINTLLNRSGIKLDGDILQDWRFNHLITSNSNASTPQEEINDRSVKVNKSSTQTITGGTSTTVVTFPNTTGDFYPGDLWASDEFTADYQILIDVDITITITAGVGDFGGIILFKNGSPLTINGNIVSLVFGGTGAADEKSLSVPDILLDAGDVLDVRGFAVTDDIDIDEGDLKIIPTKIYNVFTKLLLPDVPAKEFVAGIFALFNTVIDYNGITKVLTVNLFKSIIREDELDISQYVNPSSIEHDYTELMENYGQENRFLYEESGSEAAEKYNENNPNPYGSGVLDSENELSVDTVDIFTSDFIGVIEDIKNPFKTFLPKVSWRSISETSQRDEGVTATSSGGSLTFTASNYSVGDLVRISNSVVTGFPDEPVYNGDWIVSVATSTTFRVAGLTYIANGTVDVTKLEIKYESEDEQAILLAIPDYGISNFTDVTLMFYADTTSVSGISSPATAYFYKPIQGLDIDEYKESLSFGSVNIPNTHQITMIESYWRDFGNILKDPIKTFAECLFPKVIFDQLFNRPLRIKTSKFNARFFMNRVTGYKSSSKPCTSELIKL